MDRAIAQKRRFTGPLGAGAVIGGIIAPWRAIGGKWRAVTDSDDHYVYAITL